MSWELALAVLAYLYPPGDADARAMVRFGAARVIRRARAASC